MKKTNSAAQQSLHIPSGFFNASTSEHYSSLPMKVLFAQDPFGGDTCTLNVDWGTFLNLLSIHNGVENYALPGFCVWPKISSMNHTNATSIIVIDYPTEFDILKLAPQFKDIECASYVTNNSRDDGDIFRVLFPLLRPISPEKFFTLAPAIQKWADGTGSHPVSDPDCYRIGRYCEYPNCRKEDAGPRVKCYSPGWMLDERAFDELMNTGVLTLA